MRARGRARQTIFTRPQPVRGGEPARLLATPVTRAGPAPGRRRRHRLRRPRRARCATSLLLFAIGGPVALLLASLAGYGVASAALAPVEQMRRKAAQITEHTPGERLPVGSTDDEIARLGTTLNTMLERLERSFERERAFVADARHELRTPLAILKTEIELALREGRTQDELVDALRSAAEETDRLAELADALLVIARADGGGLALAPAALRSDELLDGVARALRARACARAVASSSSTTTRRRALTGRPRAASSRRWATSSRTRCSTAPARSTSRRARDGRRVELHVRDEGPGFPPRVHRRGVRALHARRPGARARRQRPRACRSCRSSRAPTAASRAPRTTPTAAPTSGSSCRSDAAAPAPPRDALGASRA